MKASGLTDRQLELIAGGIDLHTHTSPSIFPRLLSDRELAEEAAAAGLRAVTLKSHESSTVDRANLLHRQFGGVEAYGGLVLNHAVGGLNPVAVDVAIRMGARIVWMPTLSAKRHMEFFQGRKTAFFGGNPLQGGVGLTILDAGGQVLPEVHEIIALVRDADIILSTGHLPWQEAVILADVAFGAGLKRFLVGHPDMEINPVPLEVQIDLARKGAVVEKCYLACTSDLGAMPVAEMAEGIRRIGVDHCVLVTDYGQKHNISPVGAFARFAEEVAAVLSDKAVRQMAVTNPARFLGI